jgi:hypothetical protein
MARDELGRPDDLDTHASRRVLGRVGLAGVAGDRLTQDIECAPFEPCAGVNALLPPASTKQYNLIN